MLTFFTSLKEVCGADQEDKGLAWTGWSLWPVLLETCPVSRATCFSLTPSCHPLLALKGSKSHAREKCSGNSENVCRVWTFRVVSTLTSVKEVLLVENQRTKLALGCSDSCGCGRYLFCLGHPVQVRGTISCLPLNLQNSF